jgi:hypothetical protein
MDRTKKGTKVAAKAVVEEKPPAVESKKRGRLPKATKPLKIAPVPKLQSQPKPLSHKENQIWEGS